MALKKICHAPVWQKVFLESFSNEDEENFSYVSTYPVLTALFSDLDSKSENSNINAAFVSALLLEMQRKFKFSFFAIDFPL